MPNIRRMMMAAAGGGDAESNLYGSGDGGEGQLGQLNTSNYFSPVQVKGTGTWTSAAAGQLGLNAVKDDGTLWAWGGAANGRLGNGTTTPNICSPIQIGALTTWAKVVVHRDGAHGIKTDGTLWGWGNNSQGELGKGNTTSYSSPVQIGSLTNWSSGGSRENNVFLLKTDGTIWAIGDNAQGRLGIGDTTDRSSPVQIGALTTWALIQGGYGFGHAVKIDGTIWSWGLGGNGRTGHGNTTNYSSPVQIGSLTDWAGSIASVGAGDQHTLAVKTDGTLWAWGRNNQGQLGLGDTTNRSSPVQIGSLTTWTKVSTSLNASAAVKTDGTLWTWGNGKKGKLGHGNQTYYSSPVQVGDLTTWVRGVNTYEWMTWFVSA